MPTIEWSNPVVQGVLIAAAVSFTGVIVAALAGYRAATAGAAIGARAAHNAAALAQVESQQDREEARRIRYRDDLRLLATNLAQAAERHRTRRDAQFRQWTKIAATGGDPNLIPHVTDDQAIFDAGVALAFVAPEPINVAGLMVHAAVSQLDRPEFAYDAQVHRRGAAVQPPTADQAGFDAAVAAYSEALRKFLDLVRSELDLPPWPQAVTFPHHRPRE